MTDPITFIDGLTVEQYKSLMSPIENTVRSDGTLSSKKVNWFMHGMHVLANFFVRLFYSVFITHRWESDLNLQQRLWTDLTSKNAGEKKHLELIKEVFQSLILRFPNDDRMNESIIQKIKDLEAANTTPPPPPKPTVDPVKIDPVKVDPVQVDPLKFPKPDASDPLFILVEKLNAPVISERERNKTIEEMVNLLIKTKLAGQTTLEYLTKQKDKGQIKAYIQIISALGFSHFYLEDFVRLQRIYILNQGNSSPETAQLLINHMVTELFTRKQPLQDLNSVAKALSNTKLKQLLQAIFTALVKTMNEEKKKYPAKLSPTHPLAKEPQEIFIQIFFLNQIQIFPAANVDEIKKNFLVLLNAIEKPQWKDELIGLIKDPELQKEFRISSWLLFAGDLVCSLSQGRIEEIVVPKGTLTNEDGKNACGSICAEAIYYLSSNKNKNLSEKEMYQIIEKGAAAHKKMGYAPNPAVFSELVTKYNAEKTDTEKKLNAYAPVPADWEASDSISVIRHAAPLQFPYQDRVKKGFGDTLKLMKTLSDEKSQELYGVITCGAETVMVYYNKDGSLSLFDSHGREYLGVSKGASILRFDNVELLDKHLKEMFAKEQHYSLLFMGVV